MNTVAATRIRPQADVSMLLEQSTVRHESAFSEPRSLCMEINTWHTHGSDAAIRVVSVALVLKVQNAQKAN